MGSVNREILRIRILDRCSVLGAATALWLAGASAAAAPQATVSLPGETQSLIFVRSDENFANPERGFYRQFIAFPVSSSARENASRIERLFCLPPPML